MCHTSQTLYACHHVGLHIALRPCSTGFDYVAGRCAARQEAVDDYFERKERCLRCRERNRPGRRERREDGGHERGRGRRREVHYGMRGWGEEPRARRKMEREGGCAGCGVM